ncbi:MAG: DUF4350 domain-containing protein [Planctomycetota bacterium]|jgi:hypothetical protein
MARQRMTPIALFVLLLTVPCVCAQAQQTGDPDFNPRIDNPAYPAGKGPIVLVDGAHNNFHTAAGRYKPFADLLRQDGYRVTASEAKFTENSLQSADILVIANALHKSNVKSWALPTPSAFTEDEISAVERWVSNGGALLLIADHMPFPGAARDLAAAFGFTFNNGFAFAPDADTPGIRFSRQDGSLKDHPITRGLTSDERIDLVVTFTGHAFQGPPQAEPLLVFGKSGYSLIPQRAWEFDEDTPKISVEGWFQGAVRKHGKGRIAVFGEAAAFTAQLAGPQKVKMGMNNPDAKQNYRFVLNVMHWLSSLMQTR